MDHRDWPLWWKAANVEIAKRQKRMCEASVFPNMTEENQREYMTTLIDIINGPQAAPEDASRPSEAQEAEWAANRAELLAMYGRKK